MSDLLNSASLVMIPSGYKEDVVYSQIPTDGSGDLAFTRASNGTRVNSAGLVEVAPWNLLQYSEDFSNSYWTKDNITITANATTNPVNGQNTATAIIATAVNTYHSLTLASFSSSQPSVISIFVKAGSKSNVEIEFGSGQISFNLSTQTINYQTNATGTIESYGNGWYRISAIVPSCSYIAFIVMPGTGTSEGWTGDGTTTAVYYYGAQLNIGSTAKPYFPTTDRLNVPRLTYQNGGGGCPSLLLEKQSTNLNTYSNDFTNGWTQSGGTITATANYGISPDGTQNSTRLQFSAGNLIWRKSITGLVGNVGTWSLYIKGTAGETIAITYGGVDLLVTLASGWNRYSVTATATLNEVFVTTFLSATARNLEVWGGQCEISSYATSLIYTTSSSATRVADACFKTGVSSLIGASEGTFFVDAEVNFNADGTILASLQNTAGAFTNAVYWYITGSKFEAAIWNTPQFTGWTQITSTLTNGRHKVALAWKTNDYAFYLNGTQVGVSSSYSAVPSGMSKIDLANYVASYQSDQKFNEVVVFPTRLTNAELASLTTI